MGSFSDLSQISDLHSISRISRLNCSRIFGRIDSLHNIFEPQSSINHNASRSTVNLNQEANYLEKAAKSFTCCEDSISDYVKNKMVLECIIEVSVNRKKALPDNVAEKLKGLLLIYELNKYMHLPSASRTVREELNVLGITDLPKYELSSEEVFNVKCCVETLLHEKINEFILRHESLGGNLKETMRLNDCSTRKTLFESHDTQLLQWKDKIDELCAQYETDVLKFKILMNKWMKDKYKDLSQMYFEKSEYLLLQAQVAEVQMKITKLSCIIRMFKETPTTIDAFRTLNSAVDDKLFNTMSEIRKKEDLKKLYENLENTEYDEVLKTYLEFCKAIQKKKQILQKL